MARQVAHRQGGERRDRQFRALETPHGPGHVQGVGHQQGMFDARLCQQVRAEQRVLAGIAAFGLPPAHRHTQLPFQHVCQQVRLGGGFIPAHPPAAHQQRQAGVAMQARAIAQALQGMGADGLAAIFGRIRVPAAGQHHDGAGGLGQRRRDRVAALQSRQQPAREQGRGRHVEPGDAGERQPLAQTAPPEQQPEHDGDQAAGGRQDEQFEDLHELTRQRGFTSCPGRRNSG